MGQEWPLQVTVVPCDHRGIPRAPRITPSTPGPALRAPATCPSPRRGQPMRPEDTRPDLPAPPHHPPSQTSALVQTPPPVQLQEQHASGLYQRSNEMKRTLQGEERQLENCQVRCTVSTCLHHRLATVRALLVQTLLTITPISTNHDPRVHVAEITVTAN